VASRSLSIRHCALMGADVHNPEHVAALEAS